MRSSKSRSRSKPNRPRTLGNIVNRVFDSSGPEGKVRGTPQQIIEKYQMLAGDSQRSNDRVAAENFSQHAEHYTRMLAEAMREMAAEQESRQQSNTHQGQNRQGEYRQGEYRQDNRSDPRPEAGYDSDQPDPVAFDVIDPVDSQGMDMSDRAQPRRDDRSRSDQPRNEQQRSDQQRSEQPRNDQQRRDNRVRNDQPRSDQARSDQARSDQGRADLPRNDRPARNDQPRNDQPREDRRRDAAPQLRFVESAPTPVFDVPNHQPMPDIAPVSKAPVVTASLAQPEAPVFESPAALVAQVEAKAAPKPRAPRVKKVDPIAE